MPSSRELPRPPCWNDSKIRSRSASATPMPLSVTVTSVTAPWCSARITTDPPSPVNLTALVIRLSTTCLSRSSSEWIRPTSSATTTLSVTPCAAARWRSIGGGVLQQKAEVEGGVLQLHPPGLDLGEVEDLVEHLLELLNEILDLSKIEAGRMELEYSSIVLRTLLEDAAVDAAATCRRDGVELTVDVADDVDVVHSDVLRLKQIVLNLMTNAVKFTGAGGSVVVRARRRGARRRDHRDRQRHRRARGGPAADLRVVPAGRPGQLARGGDRARPHPLQALVELLGGRMWLESEVGVGSTFGFSLPGREREAPSRRGDADRPHLVGEVVVIEDDRPSLELLTVYLSGMAAGVTVARDGPSGLEAVRRVHPAVVLLDIRLPGSTAGRCSRPSRPTRPRGTSRSSSPRSWTSGRAGVALGAAAYLVKPVSRDDLRAR